MKETDQKGYGGAAGFSERLKLALKARCESRAGLAKALGVSSSSVSMYACGKREPSLSLLLRICDCLSVTPTELLCGDGAYTRELKKALFGAPDAPDGALSDVLEYARFVKSRFEGRQL